MSSLLHFSASMARETIKPPKNYHEKNSRLTVLQQFVIRSVILKEHHRAITNHANTVSHHRLIVCAMASLRHAALPARMPQRNH